MRFAGLCIEGWPFLIVAFGVTGVVAYAYGPLAAILPGLLSLFVGWFFRDPERDVPADRHSIVAPADGRVIDIRRVSYPRLLSGEATRVSIFMSPLNVHVNRSPLDGTVRQVEYNPGKYFAAWAEKASLENEQESVVIDSEFGTPVMVVQIAGFLARRIVCRLDPGHLISRGERYGLIRFGSRADVYLPANVDVLARQGEMVSAGESVLGRFK